MTIMYVDDDAEDIEIFQEAVQAIDPSIRYVSARNGIEAMRYLKQENELPDYVLLDINMPGMDGKSVLQEIRQDPRLAGISVIIYSTNSFPKDIDQIESMGATFIKKANSFNELLQIIRKLNS